MRLISNCYKQDVCKKKKKDEITWKEYTVDGFSDYEIFSVGKVVCKPFCKIAYCIYRIWTIKRETKVFYMFFHRWSPN